ncbi:hypothetical protein D1872_317970 [compost metagenome]
MDKFGDLLKVPLPIPHFKVKEYRRSRLFELVPELGMIIVGDDQIRTGLLQQRKLVLHVIRMLFFALPGVTKQICNAYRFDAQ